MVIMAEIAFTTIDFLCVTWPVVPVPGAKLATEASFMCRVWYVPGLIREVKMWGGGQVKPQGMMEQ